MSVLAHVVLGGALQNEPAATQALAYILKSSPDIARAFVGMLRDAGIEFEPRRIEAELEHEESQPDLTIHDSEGRARVFVENKFWAGLTDAQPVSYLSHLPEDPPSALIFIVPEQRVSAVWRELRDRCSEAGLEWADAAGNRAHIGSKIILATSWGRVLERLLDAARSGGHDDLGRDILQLRGLTNRMDAEAFLPLRGDEVTDQEMARRMVNYCDLIPTIVDELKRAEIADTDGLRPAYLPYSIGHFLRTYGRFTSKLYFDLQAWQTTGITPLWWWFDEKERNAQPNVNIEKLFGSNSEILASSIRYKGGVKFPIRLKTGVERDKVIEDAVAQMTRIADLVRKAPPL